MSYPKEMSPYGPEKDQLFMNEAFVQAQQAYDLEEVPVGAVLVNSDGEIVARGYNQVETTNFAGAHAEHSVLQQAGALLNDWRLDGFWLYVTLQPCAACMHLIQMSRLAGIVFGAHSPLFGFHLDKNRALAVYKKDAVRIVESLHPQSAQLLRQFFQKKRKERE